MLTTRAQKILDGFGYSEIRADQSDVIRPALARKDVFAVLPTGAGKSLCFQLPALAQNGLTIVVSPLLALMRDQVSGLTAKGFHAAMYSSAQSEKELEKVRTSALRGRLKLLYLSPEQLAKSSVMYWLDKCKLNRIVIDEAHCASQWGHDFRPDYHALGAWIAARPEICVSAFTATASQDVKDELYRLLFASRKPKRIFKSPHRENISLEFAAKTSPRQQLLDAVPTNGAVLIYAATRNKCEVLAKAIGGVFYHAGLESDARQKIEQDYLKGRERIIVATNAFGMGVDKADIRTVIHADMPPSIEAFVQEIGRAGRDGAPATAFCLFGDDDYEIRREQIETSTSKPEQRSYDLARLDAIFTLAKSKGTWDEIANYFDHKLQPTTPQDDSETLALLKRWRYQTAQNKKIAPFMVLPDHLLEDIAKRKPQNIDALAAIKGMGATRLAKYGDAILMTQGGQVMPTSKSRQSIALKGDGALFESLTQIGQDLRQGENGTERPVELTSTLIRRIINARPRTHSDLARISGFHEKHLARFGARILLEFNTKDR